MSETKTPKLPIKLRLKKEGYSKLAGKEVQSETDEPSAPRPTNYQQISSEPRSSKIAGTAAKTKPRIGPNFQADVPELTIDSSKRRAGWVGFWIVFHWKFAQVLLSPLMGIL